MTRWVALLRGVNVNGTTVTSADLRSLLGDLGSPGARTVLASGNAVLDAPDGEDAAAVRARVEAGLRERFGYEAFVVLLAPDRLAALAAAYPFVREDAGVHPYVVLGSDSGVLTALAERLDGVPLHEGERVQPGEGALYWQVPRGSSTDTPVAKVLAAARYRPHLTTRNLRTLERVLALARS